MTRSMTAMRFRMRFRTREALPATRVIILAGLRPASVVEGIVVYTVAVCTAGSACPRPTQPTSVDEIRALVEESLLFHRLAPAAPMIRTASRVPAWATAGRMAGAQGPIAAAWLASSAGARGGARPTRRSAKSHSGSSTVAISRRVTYS